MTEETKNENVVEASEKKTSRAKKGAAPAKKKAPAVVTDIEERVVAVNRVAGHCISCLSAGYCTAKPGA